MVKKFKETRLGPSQREKEEFFNSIKEWEELISNPKGKWIENDDPLAKNFHENSKDFNECGSKIDSELLFQRINIREFDQDLARELMKILTEDELKDRLSFENFRSIQTFKVINNYVRWKEKKELRAKNYEKVVEMVKSMRSDDSFVDHIMESDLSQKILNLIEGNPENYKRKNKNSEGFWV